MKSCLRLLVIFHLLSALVFSSGPVFGSRSSGVVIAIDGKEATTSGHFEVVSGTVWEGEIDFVNRSDKAIRVSASKIHGYARLRFLGDDGKLDIVLRPAETARVAVQLSTADVVDDISSHFLLRLSDPHGRTTEYVRVQLPLKRVGGLALSVPWIEVGTRSGRHVEQVVEVSWSGATADLGPPNVELVDLSAPLRIPPLEGGSEPGRAKLRVVFDPTAEGPDQGEAEVLVYQDGGASTLLRVSYSR